MNLNKNTIVFIELLRVGLWEKDVLLLPFGDVDWNEIYRLAQEQSVVGLVAAGLEHVTDVKAPKMVSLQFVGDTLVLEEHNRAMNDFIADLVDKMSEVDIHTLLVKGQGIAQCYERPFWRACGDVDLLLSKDNYEKAKSFLSPLASSVDPEDKLRLHQAMTIDNWIVELHGTLPFVLSSKVDKVIYQNQDEVFFSGSVRLWMNGNTQVFLPAPDNDVIFVFTHFLHHFFIEGVGLRQICDWSRLLWTYRASLDLRGLELRIKQMGLMSEWRVFAALAVETLGMPEDAMPLYKKGYSGRANRVLQHIIKSGNFGHNNDVSYRWRYSGFMSNVITFFRRLCDFVKFTFIFPVDAPRFFLTYVFGKMK